MRDLSRARASNAAFRPMSDHVAPVVRTDWVVSMIKEFLNVPMSDKNKP
ncbi:MAG: hypothetical protein HYY49_05340 [Ignavibacteriales bacterium]|nr:hypothetical protein [Ignavibacteriales bacterium]